ncbi:MAG: dephospho-CoA kinase [Candidatus Omnitrophica bacterium]|nr:dephospho-CoA kinase [Candidatus Omnitrophota bacterium]
MKKPRINKKVVLGVTGVFGSGKSTVAGIFRSYGDKVIDADKIAHQLIRPTGKIYKKIVGYFGPRILGRGRQIDKTKLAELVFNNRDSLAKLNAIMHPQIIRIIRERIKKVKRGIVVVDAPLLLETGLGDSVDKVIVVKAEKNECVKRIKKRSGLTTSQILRRFGPQMPLRRKLRLADFIIDNNGSMQKAKKQVIEIRRKLWKNLISPN